MKALKYQKPRVATIVESTPLVAHGKKSVAKVLATSISAGTEMGFYRGTAPQLNFRSDQNRLFHAAEGNVAYPMQSDTPGVWWMGYSAVGKVTNVGPEETDLKVGDLVWDSQGHKSQMASDRFVKLPPNTNVEQATLFTLVEIAFNGMLDAQVKLLDEVVIFGMGTLGQLLVQMCKLSGAHVTAVDNLPSRLELAKRLGADVTIDPTKTDVGSFVQDATHGRGADVVIEVTGNVDALPNAIRCAGNDGVVTVLSFYQRGAGSLQLGQEFHHKRTTIRSSQVGGINPAFAGRYAGGRRQEQAMKLLTKLNLEPLISHRAKFDTLPQTLEMIDRNPSDCQAVVVTY